MNEYNNNEERSLDDFLDEVPSGSGLYPTSPQGRVCVYPKGATVKKKNGVIIALLCGVLAIGIVILAFQILGSLGSNNNPNTQNQPQYEQPLVNDDDTFGNGGGNENYGNYGPDYNGNDDGGSGAELSGQYEADDGTIIHFRVKGNKAEYSTDNGKTWSETPPEGMPPLP